MALAIKWPKQPGESRYIDFLPDYGCFKASHTFNEELIAEFKTRFDEADLKCIQPRKDKLCKVERRWWRVKATKANCLALLKWGLEADYKFTTRALLKLDEVSKR